MTEKPTTVDAYIAAAPADVQAVLEQIRSTIHTAIPGAGERISYDIPTITVDEKSLVHFAAWKKHIGLYPLPPADDSLAAELAPYDTGKGTARFPLNRPIPYELIGRTVQRLAEQRRRRED